jgi:glycosyltransferase involved in cell wall biosynthesis
MPEGGEILKRVRRKAGSTLPSGRLRILYLSQYFPPEIGATQTRGWEMATRLSRMGHKITVLTEFPNHPGGVIPPSFRRKACVRSRESGMDVYRLWVFARPKKTFLTRILFYISYMGMAILRGLAVREPFDLVFATSPPLFVAVAGRILAWIRRIPYVMEVRDLWPESAVVLGELSNPKAIGLSEKLESGLYRQASAIVPVTRGIHNTLLGRGIPGEKLEFIPNGANTKLYRPGPSVKAATEEMGTGSGSFVVIYTGLMGLMHGLDFTLDTARLLMEDPDVRFVFIGDGVRRGPLTARAGRESLSNVRFLPAKPEAELPGFLNSAHAGLVTTRAMEFCHGTLPVKMFTYMACGLPLLMCVEGEARDIVENSRSGLIMGPENPGELADAVRWLKKNPKKAAEMGRRGRSFVEKFYSREGQARQLEKRLRHAVYADGLKSTESR